MSQRTPASGATRFAALALLVLAAFIGAQTARAATRRSRSASKRARAEAAYLKATRLEQRLKATPPLRRTGEDYKRVVLGFEQVYRLDPAYVKTPAALASAARIYEEMGQAYADDQFYSRAVSAYQFLIEQYPKGSASRDAQFAIAKIYLDDLENPVEARTAFQQYVKAYPHSSAAKLAQREIQKIDARLARHRGAVKQASENDDTGPQRPQPPAAIATTNETVSPAREVNSNGLVEVTGIRSWVAPSYTRVVISTGAPVKFHASHLVNPDRLVFDLDHTALSSDLRHKVFPVESGYLERVRAAQFQPTVTRVVLDVQKIVDYSVFSLPNPFRMIIDIHGTPARLAAIAGSGAASARARAGSGGNSVSRGAAASEDHMEATGRAADALDADTAGQSETSDSHPSALPTGRAVPPSNRGQSASDSANPSRSGQDYSEFPGESQRIHQLQDAKSNTAEVISRPAPLAAGSPTLTRALGLKIGRIVIDPGHGGHDTGTIGPTGLREKDVVLDVALRLRRLIERRLGSEVIMTRDDDTFIPLEERTAIANQQAADLFISIHANASRDPSARGIETYYLNFTSDPGVLALAARENATSQESVHQLSKLIQKIALSEKIDESRRFATVVDRSMSRELSREGIREPDRGVKKAPFVVLIGANMPSILAEISFLSNRHDERLLRRPAYRQKIAEALYAGVARYVSQLGAVKVASRAGPVARRTNPSSF